MERKWSKKSAILFWTVVIVLLGVGIAVLFLLKTERPHTLARPVPSRVSIPVVPPERKSLKPQIRDPSWPDPAAIRARISEELAFNGPLIFAESSAKLVLTGNEHQLLLDAIIDFQHVRAQIERPLLAVKSFNGAALVLFLPAYPEEGTALKAALRQRLNRDLSPDRAAVVLAAMEESLNESFDGFGSFSTTMRITEPRGDGTSFKIVFSNEFPDGQKPPDPKTEMARFRGDAAVGRDGLPLYYEALAGTIESYFPSDR